MTKHQIEQQLKNSGLSNHEREQLLQLLHYMMVEGVSTAPTAAAQHKRPHNNNNNKHRPGNTA